MRTKNPVATSGVGAYLQYTGRILAPRASKQPPKNRRANGWNRKTPPHRLPSRLPIASLKMSTGVVPVSIWLGRVRVQSGTSTSAGGRVRGERTFRWREGQPSPFPCHLFEASRREDSSSMHARTPPTHTAALCDGVRAAARRALAYLRGPLLESTTLRATLLTFIPGELRAPEIHASLNNPGPTLSSGSLRGEIIFGCPAGYHHDILRKVPNRLDPCGFSLRDRGGGQDRCRGIRGFGTVLVYGDSPSEIRALYGRVFPLLRGKTRDSRVSLFLGE